ncbi:KRAB-A domain-containing protein 2-like [Anoplophora glabripennis]|uniref:KRAB-A domain-containing protein 2-like n=1 Tax=Anoplophora glabripennis TaxID=217634 RepID=UPI000874A3FA|nr:KRAB-A domain-containing protein 2-like [Anoplophora glabripennis]
MDEPSTSSRQADQKQWREKFLTEILESEIKKSSHYNVLSSDKYSELVEQVEDAEKSAKRTPLQQRRLKRFGVLKIGDVTKLIAREEGNIKYYLQADELYDVIDAAHGAVGHGGRDRMIAETSKKYANIRKEMISLYLSMCDVCQQKKTKKKRGLVSKPILHSEMNSRCQVDLIDFQTQPDE